MAKKTQTPWLRAVVFGVLVAPITVVGRDDAAFREWLAELRKEALSKGISPAALDLALDSLTPNERVLELQRQQPEGKLSFDQYVRRVVPSSRIVTGRKLLAYHRELLVRVGAKYGVQPRFIVALWGIESDFGRNMGDFPVIGSLATIAFAGRNRSYFRRELVESITLIDKGVVSPSGLVGSWAGAMGQCQFMPSTYSHHAVDFDGDGGRDIWHTPADIFASMAHFLDRLGWHDDQTWGREVRLPPDFDNRLSGQDTRMRLSRWQALGVRRADGRDLPTRDLWAVLVLSDSRGGRAFLVYDNYHALLRWNRSNHFALSVGYLADRLR